MDKKEKYINYVVNNLVTQTKIDYDQGKILPPSHFPTHLFSLLPHPNSHYPILTTLFFYYFSKYITERYGIHDNDVDNTWEIYKGKIKEVIDNG